MKIRYFNIKERTLEEIICAKVLFGVETVAVIDDDYNKLAIINIDHIYSVEQ